MENMQSEDSSSDDDETTQTEDDGEDAVSSTANTRHKKRKASVRTGWEGATNRENEHLVPAAQEKKRHRHSTVIIGYATNEL